MSPSARRSVGLVVFFNGKVLGESDILQCSAMDTRIYQYRSREIEFDGFFFFVHLLFERTQIWVCDMWGDLEEIEEKR